MSEGNGRDRRNYAPRPLHLRPVLTSAEQQRLWDACLVWCPRERLVLVLLLEAGLCRREVCALTFHDLQPGALSIRGKDGRVRTMPIGNETKLALDRYLAAALPSLRRHQDADAALVGLDEADLAEYVRALGKRAGLNRPLSSPDLRRAAIARAWAAHGKGDDK
jgi:integrase